MIGLHGHVVPRPDGVKVRCGGPALCDRCAGEAGYTSAAQYWAAHPTDTEEMTTMSDQVPTICRMLAYKLSAADVQEIQAQPNPRFNPVTEGDVFPALVVRTFSTQPDAAVNLRVFIDGEPTLWATSRRPGDEPGQWQWPART